MAEDINSELQFKELYNKLSPEEKAFWLPKEVFFLSLRTSKLSATQDDMNTRLKTVEDNCKKALCNREPPEDPECNKPSRRTTIKHVAYGGVGTLGTGGIIWGIVEIVKVLAQRGG